jgi:hypothetical protein
MLDSSGDIFSKGHFGVSVNQDYSVQGVYFKSKKLITINPVLAAQAPAPPQVFSFVSYAILNRIWLFAIVDLWEFGEVYLLNWD